MKSISLICRFHCKIVKTEHFLIGYPHYEHYEHISC